MISEEIINEKQRKDYRYIQYETFDIQQKPGELYCILGLNHPTPCFTREAERRLRKMLTNDFAEIRRRGIGKYDKIKGKWYHYKQIGKESLVYYPLTNTCIADGIPQEVYNYFSYKRKEVYWNFITDLNNYEGR